MTILELREKRNTAWNAAKAFFNSHRTEKGTLTAEDDATYSGMEQEIADLGKEIARLERQKSLETELNKPVNNPLTSKQGNSATDKPAKTGRASDEYKNGILQALHTNFRQVSNILQEGIDADNCYLVQEEYDSRLIDVLTEENIIRSLGHTITTSGEHKINIAATGDDTVAGTLSVAIKSDDMLDLVYALKRPYRKNASFIMNDKTLGTALQAEGQ